MEWITFFSKESAQHVFSRISSNPMINLRYNMLLAYWLHNHKLYNKFFLIIIFSINLKQIFFHINIEEKNCQFNF